MALRMLPKDEELYRQQLMSATPEQMSLALLLHAAAFNGSRPTIPAPVYMRQAVHLCKHGYKLCQFNDEQVRGDEE